MAKATTKPPKLTKHQFYFETPLYEAVHLDRADIHLFSGEVDAYSARNLIDTTYKVESERIDDYQYKPFYNYYKIALKCKRKTNDTLQFIVLVDPEEVVCVKVGQWPSLADLQYAEVGKKYDKLLERDDLQQFKKAIGLAAHGVGAGSFVYLRRIFEKLIDQTFEETGKNLGITEEAYKKMRMDEKVGALKDMLPSQLVTMKKVYKILSAGVHELSEQECLTYFPALKLSIELILEQQIEKETKAVRDKAVLKQIEDIQKQIS